MLLVAKLHSQVAGMNNSLTYIHTRKAPRPDHLSKNHMSMEHQLSAVQKIII